MNLDAIPRYEAEPCLELVFHYNSFTTTVNPRDDLVRAGVYSRQAMGIAIWADFLCLTQSWTPDDGGRQL